MPLLTYKGNVSSRLFQFPFSRAASKTEKNSVFCFYAQDSACNALNKGKCNITPTPNIFDFCGEKKKQ